jgi:peptidyl-dipeptidase Dcp
MSVTKEQLSAENPFAAASTLPYELPPFDRITDDDYLPAFRAGMQEHLAEIEAIASNPEDPTFENTLVAMERAGQLLNRVAVTFFSLASSDKTEQLQEIEGEIAPKLAAHQDAIYLNGDLFRRVDGIFKQRDALKLDQESDRLLERTHTKFVRAGAALPEGEQARLREINERLATLTTDFGHQLLADTNDLAVLVDDASELAGLPDDRIAAAAAAAEEKGHSGKYLLTLIAPTSQPALAFLDNREVRERLHRASISRCDRGNDNDTKSLLLQIVSLRAERAKLLGYSTHSAYIADDRMAGSQEAALGLLEQLAKPGVENAEREAEELQAYLEKDHPGATLEAWDRPYYVEKVRKDKFELDDGTFRQYFELENVLHDGIFYAANQVYGLTFKERPDLPVYHPEVRTFEVFDHDGSALGLFLMDYYTRDAKRGGAWMGLFVEPSHLLDQKPVAVNVLNVPRPAEGEPTLLTFDEVRTAFHEFGHALHGLLADSRYPSIAHLNVSTDFVEFPSQVNEMWILWPEVLTNYAKHFQTGEPLPQELIDRVDEAQKFGQGYATTEYLAASLLDQAWHQLTTEDKIDDVNKFEAEALERFGVAVRSIPPRYRSTYFAHIFADFSDFYSAGYYSYIWSEVIDADAVEWFRENGGMKRENGDHLRREVLSRGATVDAAEAYRNFRGRDAVIEPLLKRRGLD